jgi:hypothetical protein
MHMMAQGGVFVTAQTSGLFAASPEALPGKICVFSKHLHWLDYDGMARMAANIGLDGGTQLSVQPEVVEYTMRRDFQWLRSHWRS